MKNLLFLGMLLISYVASANSSTQPSIYMPAPKPIIMSLFQDNIMFTHKDNEQTEKELLLTVNDLQCKGLQTQAYLSAISAGWGETRARNLGYSIYFGCMSTSFDPAP